MRIFPRAGGPNLHAPFLMGVPGQIGRESRFRLIIRPGKESIGIGRLFETGTLSHTGIPAEPTCDEIDRLCSRIRVSDIRRFDEHKRGLLLNRSNHCDEIHTKIHGRFNRKYFGTGRGVTFFNFLSDQFTGFHHVVIPGTLREALYVLDGLLDHSTQLRPKEVMTDTNSYTDVVFGLFWLLGFQFSPRLADIKHQRFWRMDRQADYGMLNLVTRSCISVKRVTADWDDMLRVAGSLHTGAGCIIFAMLLTNDISSSNSTTPNYAINLPGD